MTKPLDPDVASLLQLQTDILAALPQPLSIEDRRHGMREFTRRIRLMANERGTLPELVVRDEVITSAAGPLAARRYLASSSSQRTVPLMVYFHGGGWVIGDLDTHDELMVAVSAIGGVDVLAIDYRLAPETPFTAAIDDGLAAVDYARMRAPHQPLLVGGDSAGAHLAAVTAHQTQQAIQGMFLLYPAVSPAMQTPSFRDRGAGPSLTADAMRWYWGQWLARDIPTTGLHTDDVRIDLLHQTWRNPPPPAVIVAAWHDPLHDEAWRYAEHLRTAGGRAHALSAADMAHGFARHWRLSASARTHLSTALGALTDWLR